MKRLTIIIMMCTISLMAMAQVKLTPQAQMKIAQKKARVAHATAKGIAMAPSQQRMTLVVKVAEENAPETYSQLRAAGAEIQGKIGHQVVISIPVENIGAVSEMKGVQRIDTGHKGKWKTLQSGEIVYIYPSGTYAHSIWIKDGNKYYYVDVSGCRMKNNYAHDGFYAGIDGSWDKKVKCIDKNVLPRNGKDYLDISAQKWVFQMQTHPDGTINGTARHTYGEGVGVVEDCVVKSFGHSAYSIFNKKNEFVSYHMVVLDEGRTIRVSAAGETDVFHTSIGI